MLEFRNREHIDPFQVRSIRMYSSGDVFFFAARADERNKYKSVVEVRIGQCTDPYPFAALFGGNVLAFE